VAASGLPERRVGDGGAASDGLIITGAALACAALWLVVLHPGFMSPDSADQLRQARRGIVADWHAPLLTFLWIATERLVTGPFGMLILQTAAFWTGLALLAKRIAAPVAPKIAFLVGLALAPPIVTLAGAIWKDVLMVSLVTLAFGVADRRVAFWPVALLATMSRHNAIAAVAVAVLLHFSPEGVTRQGLRRALAASAVLLVLSLAFNFAVVDRRTYPMQVFLLGDLIGIAVTTSAVPEIDPCNLKQGQAPPRRAVQRGDPKIVAADVANRTQLKPCMQEGAGAASRTLVEQWIALVFQHPTAYARVRAKLSYRLLGFDETPFNFTLPRSTYDPVAMRIEPQVPPTPLQEWLGAQIWSLRDSAMFRPWIYGVLGIAACGVAAARRRRWPCFIALSGLACELGLFFVAPAPEYRYSSWMIASALIASAWLAAEAIGALRTRA